MWEPKINDWSKVTIEHAKFIFSQAEKRVDESVKTADLISSKLYNLLTLNAALFVGIGGYISSNVYKEGVSREIFSMAVIAAIYLLLIIIYIFLHIKPKGFYTSGSQPKDLFVQEFFEVEDADISTMYFYAQEAKNYQERISHNATINTSRAKSISIAIVAMILLPILLTLLFIS